MNLPFDLPEDHLPVMIRRPKVRSRELADETVVFEAHNVKFLQLPADRGLFEIGFMMEIRQFAKLTAAERFAILALWRKIRFSRQVEFPGLAETHELLFVDNSKKKLVWATIPAHVIETTAFTVADLCNQGMAVDESEALLEVIADQLQDCPNADPYKLLQRFADFKTPHKTDIRRALPSLVKLGFVKEYINVNRRRRRAVFNMHMVAATTSGILAGMIAAKNYLREDRPRVDGAVVEFASDVANAATRASRKSATTTGRKAYIYRDQYQAMYEYEYDERRKMEGHIARIKRDGHVTDCQFAALRNTLADPRLPDDIRRSLTDSFASAYADPLTEIPAPIGKKERRNA